MKLLCIIFGHNPVNVDTKRFTATCSHCGSKLQVCYDMFYGHTLVEGVLKG